MQFIKDNKAYYINEIWALYPDISFPVGYDVKELGFEVLHETEKPADTDVSFAVQDGWERSGDRWVVKWKQQPYTEEQLAEKVAAAEVARVASVKALIADLENRITPRMLREVLLDLQEANPQTGKTAKQQIADWEAEIQGLRASL